MFRFRFSLLSHGVALTALSLTLGCGVETPNDTRTPVAKYGLLQISAGKLSDANGNPVQLRGMSLFYSNWGGAWFNESAVDQAVDYLGCEIIRAPLAVMKMNDAGSAPLDADGGYLSDPDGNKARVKRVVEEAIYKGTYVIIDWHDHVAESHQAQAVSFFTEMATTYGNKPNVLFEIYNEPFTQDWNVIKAYADAVVTAIRNTGARNVIIVGTPNFSQQVEKAVALPIGDQNTAYALHFYAGTHPLANWQSNLESALSSSIAVVVTEWGTCNADGKGALDTTHSDEWVNWMQTHQISWANWELFDKAEAAAMFVTGTSFVGPWTEKDLTADGVYVKSKLPAAVSQMVVSPSLLVFDHNGGTLATTLRDNTMYGWAVNSTPSWLTVSPTSGSYLGGSGTISITATAYDDPTTERTGFVELSDGGGYKAHVTVIQQPNTGNLALNRPASSSGDESASYPPQTAVDGDRTNTRWASAFADNQWICVDLGQPYYITGAKLYWEPAYSTHYHLALSDTSCAAANADWKEIYDSGVRSATLSPAPTDQLDSTMINSATSGQYIRMWSDTRALPYGVSLYEFEVYGHP